MIEEMTKQPKKSKKKTSEQIVLFWTYNCILYNDIIINAIIYANLVIYAIYDKIVTPCFDSLAIRHSPYTKDTSSQHPYAPGFKGLP